MVRLTHGGLVGGGGVIDLEFVLVGEGVDHFGGEGAGEALFAIFADVGQFAARDRRRLEHWLGGPDVLVEALGAAVQRVSPLFVGGEL